MGVVCWVEISMGDWSSFNLHGAYFGFKEAQEFGPIYVALRVLTLHLSDLLSNSSGS